MHAVSTDNPGRRVVSTHGDMELRVISILMVLYAVLRYDVAYRTTVDGEQQRSQYRSSRDADVEAHGW